MPDINDIIRRIDHIPHLTGPTQAKWLFHLLQLTGINAAILEIGTYYGYMTACLALSSDGSQREVFSIDHMIGGSCDIKEGERCFYDPWRKSLVALGVWNRIVPFPMKSIEALTMLEKMHCRFRMVYMDGCHSQVNVLKEVELIDPLLEVGGFICGDDCTLRDNLNVYHPDLTFNLCWDSGMEEQFCYKHPDPEQGVSPAVWKFFRNNERFVRLDDVPGNQFGFIKAS